MFCSVSYVITVRFLNNNKKLSLNTGTWCVHAHIRHHTTLHERVEKVVEEQRRDGCSNHMKRELKRYQKDENVSSIMKYCISMVEAVHYFSIPSRR